MSSTKNDDWNQIGLNTLTQIRSKTTSLFHSHKHNTLTSHNTHLLTQLERFGKIHHTHTRHVSTSRHTQTITLNNDVTRTTKRSPSTAHSLQSRQIYSLNSRLSHTSHNQHSVFVLPHELESANAHIHTLQLEQVWSSIPRSNTTLQHHARTLTERSLAQRERFESLQV